ncbi:MAG: hypothetical protein BMS9Abin36_0977 [Gammaproteobacteria bacterium]|nr:MAG: hypothetical protein BMS9Abin36_0977 [Gammaproteobacteria bacterium]
MQGAYSGSVLCCLTVRVRKRAKLFVIHLMTQWDIPIVAVSANMPADTEH